MLDSSAAVAVITGMLGLVSCESGALVRALRDGAFGELQSYRQRWAVGISGIAVTEALR